MSMPTKEYWEKRFIRNALINEKNALEYEKDLKKAYETTIKSITKEINAFYGKHAAEEEISLTWARKRLQPDKLHDFQMQAKKYLDEIKKLGDAAFTEEYRSHLDRLSGKAYVSQMDELITNIRHNIETLSTGYNKGLGQTLEEAYEEGFYRTMHDIQNQTKVGVGFTTPGGKQLEEAVKSKWLGDNYSDRIWNDKNKLIKELEPLISQQFVRGRGPNDLARDLAGKLGVSYNNARRLIRTEMNHISNEAAKKAYEESGVVDKYMFMATLDSRTSEICSELDGKIIDVKDGKAGINLPPMHPYCRSTTVPYFEDDNIGPLIESRMARDNDGRGSSVRIGENLKYYDWVDKYGSESFKERMKKRKRPELPEVGQEPAQLYDYQTLAEYRNSMGKTNSAIIGEIGTWEDPDTVLTIQSMIRKGKMFDNSLVIMTNSSGAIVGVVNQEYSSLTDPNGDNATTIRSGVPKLRYPEDQDAIRDIMNHTIKRAEQEGIGAEFAVWPEDAYGVLGIDKYALKTSSGDVKGYYIAPDEFAEAKKNLVPKRLQRIEPEEKPKEEVKKKLDFTGKNGNEVREFIRMAGPDSGYSLNEITDAYRAFLGRDISDVYSYWSIKEMAERFGLGTYKEFEDNPFLLDMKLNNITEQEAKNRVLSGFATQHLIVTIRDEGITSKALLDRIEDVLPMYRKGFTVSEVVEHINYIYKNLEKNTKDNVAKAIIEKAKYITPYKTALNKVLDRYGEKGFDIERIDKYLEDPSLYDSILDVEDQFGGVDLKMMKKKLTAKYMKDPGRYEQFEEDLKNAPLEYQRVFSHVMSNIKKVYNYDPSEGAYFSRSDKSINIDEAEDQRRAQVYGVEINKTLFHEMGHAIDYIGRKGVVGIISNSDKAGFKKTMLKEIKKMIDPNSPGYRKLHKTLTSKWKTTGGMQDVLEGSNYIGPLEYRHSIPTRWGHGAKYWKRNDPAQEMASELFAHMSAAYVLKNDDYKVFEEFMPETLNKFDEIIKDMAAML